MMKPLVRSFAMLPWLFAVILCCASTPRAVAQDAKPFLGYWALNLPGGGAGWLGVESAASGLKASLLWGGGSVVPVDGVKVDGDKLVVTRLHKSGKNVTTETITATRTGDSLSLTTSKLRPDGKVDGKADFQGKLIPPVPAKPVLAKVKFGEAIPLFNGRDLTGWKPLDAGAANGWSVQGGVLVNDPKQEEGKPHRNYTNLRTERDFEDFRLTIEARPTKGSNSGIYLRGIYEVQVLDSYGKPLDSHNMGAIYSRITPSVAAEKPAGEWQTLDITLVDRHATVILNGKTIIDNQPVLGCTGGALWSDQFRPGPLYLQGDHSQIEYRNIVLRPVVK